MSLSERNQFLEILNKNGSTKDQIKFIMNDLKDLFPATEILDDEWDPLEDEANEIFNPDRTEEDVKHLIDRSVLEKERLCRANELTFYHKLLEKQKEIEEHELTEAEQKKSCPVYHRKKVVIKEASCTPQKEVVGFVVLRYGRTPLHEAIAIGDLEQAEVYIKAGQFLTETDNNGYTAEEMAYHLGYKEAIALFKKYKKQNEARKKGLSAL